MIKISLGTITSPKGVIYQLKFDSSKQEVYLDRKGKSEKIRNAKNSTDWRNFVRQITEIARANNFEKDILEKSKILSFQTFDYYLQGDDIDPSKPPLSMDAYLATLGELMQI